MPKYQIPLLCLSLLFTRLCPVFCEEPSRDRLKVLHLTFHQGCAKSVNAIAQELGLALETWMIPDLTPYFLDGTSSGTALYNISHNRAEKIWDLHKEEFEKFDVIFTSDTAPLARIFLQNEWKKPLIIWVCDRFDYCDGPQTSEFPDKEFYHLFNNASTQSNVTIVVNTEFERVYARSKGVDLGSLVIKPFLQLKTEELPQNTRDVFYLPAYHNETNFMNLSGFLSSLNISNFGGRHNGLDDLKSYKGIIHLPYAWSTIALFENISIGIPYFLPSKKLLHKFLSKKDGYWHQYSPYLTKKKLYEISEWYNKEHREIFTYFDSSKDLQKKIQKMDYSLQRKKILAFAKQHEKNMVQRWKMVFAKYQACKSLEECPK